jgi:hypothetical protein
MFKLNSIKIKKNKFWQRDTKFLFMIIKSVLIKKPLFSLE